MTIQLVFLARLRERFGVSREGFALTADINTVAALLDALRQRGGAFAEELAAGRAFRVAVNQDVVALDHPVNAGAFISNKKQFLMTQNTLLLSAVMLLFAQAIFAQNSKKASISTISVQTGFVNEQGAGWQLADFRRLIPQSVLLQKDYWQCWQGLKKNFAK